VGWRTSAALLLAAVALIACGSGSRPAQTSPASSPTSSPTQQPEPTSSVAAVTCTGGQVTTMSVVAGQLRYDVSDPIHRRLICRAQNTYVRLLDSGAIAYTTVVAGKVVAVRGDLTTGTEARIAELRVSPDPYYYGATAWSSDGRLEVYAVALPPDANGLWQMQIHMSSNGADHVLYTIPSGAGGIESRWAAHTTLELSPDHAYIAISDSNFSLTSHNVRIFSIADQRQVFIAPSSALGGTWTANDRFIWASSGSVMQWTRAGGASWLRSEQWFGPTSSSGGQWLAATLLTDYAKPRVVIVPIAGGRTLVTGLGSNPGFVTSTTMWYSGERPCPPGDQCMADSTTPDRTVHAYNVTNGSDQLVVFRNGEEPILNGSNCCGPRS